MSCTHLTSDGVPSLLVEYFSTVSAHIPSSESEVENISEYAKSARCIICDEWLDIDVAINVFEASTQAEWVLEGGPYEYIEILIKRYLTKGEQDQLIHKLVADRTVDKILQES